MKKRLSCIALVLGLVCLIILVRVACSSLRTATSPLDSTSLPDSLICWEQTSSGRLEFGKINAIRGLAADGDLLWIATDRGLARLDLRTWTCDLFTEAAGVSLMGCITLLPDGNGGLWIGEPFRYEGHGAGLVFYSEGAWQGTRLRWWESIDSLALTQAGQIWVGVSSGRTYFQMCSRESTFPPLHWDSDSYNVDPYPYDPLVDCDVWQRMSWGGTLRYTSPAECELANDLDPEQRYLPILANGNEVWFMDRHPPDGVGAPLLHQKGKAVEELSGPFSRYDVKALALDPVRGGLWMSTPDGLVYAESTATGDYVFQPIPLLLGGTNAQGDRYVSVSRSFPGEAASLVVDAEGQVWAVNGESLLRYDEGDREWWQILSDTKSVDAIAADPVRGVWAAGREHLVYFDGVQSRRWPMPDGFRGTPTALLVDRDRVAWMGTTRDGVWMAEAFSRSTDSPLNWHMFGPEQGLENTLITTLAQAPDGRIYAAHHAGVSVFVDGAEGGRWSTLPGSDVGGDWVWANALAFGSGGDDLWVGYYPGTIVRRYRHTDSKWTNYVLPGDPRKEWDDCSPVDSLLGLLYGSGVGALWMDDDGTLWVGLAANTWSQTYYGQWYKQPGYPECKPSGLWRWPAAGEGDPRWQAMAPRMDGPAPLSITSLAQDAQGRTWAGGQDPVAVWEEKR